MGKWQSAMENMGLRISNLETSMAASVEPSFWRDKRVLLTGHTGFKGSWLSIWLKSMGAELQGLALDPPTKPSLFNDANVATNMRSAIGDIRDYKFVSSVVLAFKPEIVIHMAAQPLVRYSYKNPIETYATNVMGTVHLLEAIRSIESAKVLVNVTTDKCYENKEWVWGYREDDPVGGFDPYSSSKACVELVTSAYRRSYFECNGVALASARAGNVIGGGDWAQDRLVPDTLRAFEGGIPVIIRNPNAIRPWQHVLEPLSGYLILAQKLWSDPITYAQGWNFGPRDEDSKSVEWIVRNLADKWGGSATWSVEDGKHPHEAGYLKLDISKASALLGWEPRWSLGTSLEKIVEWDTQVRAKIRPASVCLDQILMYTKS
jgi:CDP-glucose 4,6-dehydratase